MAENALAKAELPGAHFYTFLCDFVFEDKRDKSNYIGVFQSIGVSQFPGGLAQFFVVVGLSAAAAFGRALEIRFGSEDGTWERSVQTIHLQADLAEVRFSRSDIFTLNLGVPNLEFPFPGIYEVRVLLDDSLVHVHPFTVGRAEDVLKPNG